jgi:phosphoserine aminotransferase
MATRNREKAAMLYEELDGRDFWQPHAHVDARSLMNVTWRAPSEALEAQFISEADKAGLKGLKGHRSVGGIRASIYNACPVQSVHDLVAFMREFADRNQG